MDDVLLPVRGVDGCGKGNSFTDSKTGVCGLDNLGGCVILAVSFVVRTGDGSDRSGEAWGGLACIGEGVLLDVASPPD